MTEDCKAFFEKLSEYLDGGLDSETCEAIHKHLESCPACQKRFESLKKTVEICKKYPREKVPAEARQRLLAAIEAHLGRDRS